VRYQFEVYRDAALTRKVAEGTSTNPGWIVSQPLADTATHWWRVRAVDELGAASAWSAVAVLYVSTGPYQDPSIQVTSPAVPVAPTVVAEGKSVKIEWEGTNPNIEPTIALYYATSKASFNGTLIVDGLRQDAGKQKGSYTWDVGALAVGTYYVYAVIYDAKGVGKAWSPGAVVVTPAVQTGGMAANPSAFLFTTEDGSSAKFLLHLTSKPTAPVTVPVSASDARIGFTTPAAITFTPNNWDIDQIVTVTGKPDCMRTGSRPYQVLLGKAVSTDPQYLGVSGKPVGVTSGDSAYSPSLGSNYPRVGICALNVLSMKQIDATTWEYVIEAYASNMGVPLNGFTATLVEAATPLQFVQPKLEFGAMQTNEAGRSLTTITVRARVPYPVTLFKQNLAFRWSVTTR
jgi:hypothetical protein